MSRRLGVAAGGALILLTFLVGRPYGDRLPEVATGGSSTGALLLGLLVWAVPLALGVAYAVPQLRQRARGVAHADVHRPRAVGIAFWVAFVPLMTLPVLGSKSAGDTPIERSPLFGHLMAGFFGGVLLMVVVMVVMRAWHDAATRAGEQARAQRRAVAAPSRPGKQTPDKVRRKRARR